MTEKSPHGNARSSAKSDARFAASQQKAAAALKLREGGATLQAICEALGYANKSSASSAIHKAIRRIPAKNVAKYRKTKLAELEALRLAALPSALDGDASAILAATKVVDTQCKLMGAFPATRTEMTGADGGPVEVLATAHDELLARLAHLAASRGAGEPPAEADAK